MSEEGFSHDPVSRMIDEQFAHVPFNRAYATGREHAAIADAIERGHLSADGLFSNRCRAWLESALGHAVRPAAALVHRGAGAGALLLDFGPGDEVIMPSFTFVTTATAFALRGATPVFVDVRPDTLNLDEALVEAAVTDADAGDRRRSTTRGWRARWRRCRRSPRARPADRRGRCAGDVRHLRGARHSGRSGDLGAISFHETKNVTCGHGGALVVNDPSLVERAEMIRDKGTNRSNFVRGEVDRYTWTDLGSSYAISDIAAAFLWPQLEDSAAITRHGRAAVGDLLRGLRRGRAVRPPAQAGRPRRGSTTTLTCSTCCCPTHLERDELIAELDKSDINAVFHYVPLHSSPAGRRYGRSPDTMPVTDDVSGRLVRLPLWNDMTPAIVERVVGAVNEAVARRMSHSSVHAR